MEDLQGVGRDDDLHNTKLEHDVTNVFNCNKLTTFSFRSIILFNTIYSHWWPVRCSLIWYKFLIIYDSTLGSNLILVAKCLEFLGTLSKQLTGLWHVVAVLRKQEVRGKPGG